MSTFLTCCVCVCLCSLFNFFPVMDCMFVCSVLSHPYKCVSCGLWQYNYNFGDSLICLESKIDLNHMGDLLVDLTRYIFFSFMDSALLLIFKQVLCYLTHYGS